MTVKMHQRRRRSIAEINVVPYIDVMLVLLVIFMMTTPLLSQGVKVDLPQATANPLAVKEKEPIILSINAKGDYFLNIAQNPNETVDASTIVKQVTAELQKAKQQGDQRIVLVKGDKQVDYGTVVQGMVLLQQAGAENVGLMTETNHENP